MPNIESFLSARLFLEPQIVGDRIYFISNLNGRNSLYVMNKGGSVPEPLLPPGIALQNPHLIDGESFIVFPGIGKILVMIDQDGDENYQPMFIPMSGGYPQLAFGPHFKGHSVIAETPDVEKNIVTLIVESRTEAIFRSYKANLRTVELAQISEGQFGMIPEAKNFAFNRYILAEFLGAGDIVLYVMDGEDSTPKLFFGIPMEDRQQDVEVVPNGIDNVHFIPDESGILFSSRLFDDHYSLGYLLFDAPLIPQPIETIGLAHHGDGELKTLKNLAGNRYLLEYNIDGCTWAYEAELDEENWRMVVNFVLVGEGVLSNGVLESIHYDKKGDRFALSYSTATTPTQIYTIEGTARDILARHTNETILGVPPSKLAVGEDYSFTSYDGLRVSARLYMPAEELGFRGSRPLVYYIHGGPQSQERPDFAWFSMPFIQFLTMNGFAVFVPNVRGSTGYGFNYMNQVVRDWGGKDRLDHVHAMTEILSKDGRIDIQRAGVVGRSYGGFMTLTLASRYPQLWAAAIDMFGPYDLLTFAERVPESWKPFIKMLIGDPDTERDFMRKRSPRSYIHQVRCPMLVIQGKNDPRVLEIESHELVEELQKAGKYVEYLMFEDEGHDVLKYENRVTIYNRMTEFFKKHLGS